MSLTQDAQTPTIVTPQILLANHLKALKLPTFVREYDKVALEAAQDRVDYPRYLLRLCELERIDRERLPRDEQDESAASIRMRIGSCCVVEGRRA